jgi:hypothetical protein
VKGKKPMAREWPENFLAGGFLVLLALWVAYASTPVLGGIIAALPIKFAITWILAGIREGPAFAQKMAEGSIIGMTGNLLFSLTLFLTLSSFDLFTSFSLALLACLIAIALLRLTFRE